MLCIGSRGLMRLQDCQHAADQQAVLDRIQALGAFRVARTHLVPAATGVGEITGFVHGAWAGLVAAILVAGLRAIPHPKPVCSALRFVRASTPTQPHKPASKVVPLSQAHPIRQNADRLCTVRPAPYRFPITAILLCGWCSRP